MKTYLVPVLGALMLTGCSNASAIEDAVRESLIDPDSAKFGELIEYTDDDGTEMACIMVNAKNRMGGYTGESMFVVVNADEAGWQALGDISSMDCETYVETQTQPDAE